jgi:DNA polymerase V
MDLTAYCQGICSTVKQWTGIPISIGISPTKTLAKLAKLAKLANRLVKKGLSAHGAVLDWRTQDAPDEILATIALDEIGAFPNVGRQN